MKIFHTSSRTFRFDIFYNSKSDLIYLLFIYVYGYSKFYLLPEWANFGKNCSDHWSKAPFSISYIRFTFTFIQTWKRFCLVSWIISGQVSHWIFQFNIYSMWACWSLITAMLSWNKNSLFFLSCTLGCRYQNVPWLGIKILCKQR